MRRASPSLADLVAPVGCHPPPAWRCVAEREREMVCVCVREGGGGGVALGVCMFVGGQQGANTHLLNHSAKEPSVNNQAGLLHRAGGHGMVPALGSKQGSMSSGILLFCLEARKPQRLNAILPTGRWRACAHLDGPLSLKLSTFLQSVHVP